MPKNNKPKLGPAALEPCALYRRCDPQQLPFTTSAELEDIDVTVGQTRALAALEFGLGMQSDGYNLFVLGRAGSHRHRIVRDFLEAKAPERGAPTDWCYLHDFEDERKPLAVRLPAGRGRELRQDMARLIEELRGAIQAAFDSEQYRNSIVEINQELEERHRAAIEQLQHEAKQNDLSLVPTPHGFAIAPTRDGRLLADEQFERLPVEERERTTEQIERMSEKLRRHFEELPKWQKEQRDRIKALNRDLTENAAGQLIDQVKQRYLEFPGITAYLDAVREDVLANARDFQSVEESTVPMPALRALNASRQRTLTRYAVNLLVDHADNRGAPIVYENHPSIQNLLGRIEHVAELGALVTDFTMIRAGALHRANGGFLILDADRLLMEPLAWNALKRTLAAREIRIESLGQLMSLVSTVSLEPEPIPLDLKVILIGERQIYYLLCELDSDFAELFKVAADLENRLDRTPENTALYARLVATLARRANLPPLTSDAVARVIERGARLLDDSEKLTTRLRDISDLVREASYWATEDASAMIEGRHVQRAIDAQIHRSDRLRSELQEEIRRNSILIDTRGAKIGQINGLTVLELGGFSFGQPARITASARMGEGRIIDIERETELGGAIHSKGVLILSSYLASRYATDTPLSMSASLVFEQSYGEVEGDSASVAETCALLSALAELPIKQALAVTGSVNQHGDVQVIGGVNDKIEGFFDTCKARGLTGDQGVLIPADNVKHLMLRHDVVEAVRERLFHVYPISHVDDALAALTGVPAGQRDSHGAFPRGTANYRVELRLRKLAEAVRQFDHERGKRRKKKRPKKPGKKIES